MAAATVSWGPFCPSESCELDLPGPWTPGKGGEGLGLHQGQQPVMEDSPGWVKLEAPHQPLLIQSHKDPSEETEAPK